MTSIKILYGIGIVSLILAFTVGVSEWNTTPSGEPFACTMEARICPDGTAVGRTGPTCEFEECPATEDTPPSVEDTILLDSPIQGQTISSPVAISGSARGNWFFEASFPIVIVNWDGLIIGEGYATAQGDWMTTEFVPFTGTISYTLPKDTPYNRGAIILKKDNPSGLPEHDDSRQIPILLTPN